MGRALPLPFRRGKRPLAASGGDLAGSVGLELPGGVDEIARVDEVIAVEHLARPPADQLHRDALDDAGADEVADGRPAEIMEDAAGHPGGATRRRPGLVEAPDRRAVRAGEDMRDDAPELPFPLTRDRAAPLEERAQVGREREDAALAGLRGPRLEPDLAGVEGDVRPAEPGGFGAPAPAREVEERHEVGQVGRQPAAHRLEFLRLEEPAPRIVLAQEGDVGPRRDGARRDREREGAAQHGELAVDGRVPGALLLSPQDIAADVPRRDRGQAAPPEERAEVQAHVAFDVAERALAVHAVVLEAVERRDGAWAGLRFVLPARDGESPWGEMREGLRAWLARRDVVRHPRSGRFELLTRSLRGQIDSIDDDGGPVVLVDDLELGWDELGRLLESYEGWHLRIEIRDPSEAFD